MADWSIFGGNPVPGDPGQIKLLASSLHSFADDVNTQNSLLKGLKNDTTGVWQGPAADAFRPHLTDLPDKLDKLVTSYREAGDAFSTYGPKLAQAQTDALAALTKATAAMQRLNTAKANKSTQDAANQKAAAAVAAGHPAVATAQPDYGAQVQQAQSDLNAAFKAKDNAVDDARKAANNCVSDLKNASHDGIQNVHHHWWDAVINVITHPTKLLKIISMVANTLSGIFGILALITCWIPGVGEFFEAASLITGLVGLAADLTLACMGKGSWADVLTDTLAVATAGGGHILAEAGRGGEVVADGEKVIASGESKVARASEMSGKADKLETAGKARAAAGASKGDKVVGRAQQASAKANRTAAGKMAKAGEKEISRGQKAVDEVGDSQLKYGASQTGKNLPGYLKDSTLHPVKTAGEARTTLSDARMTKSYSDMAKDYFGNGNPAVWKYRAAGLGVSAYGTAVATGAAAKTDVDYLRTGDLLPKPGSASEQVHDFVQNADLSVYWHLNDTADAAEASHG
jgi:hypothetical protein